MKALIFLIPLIAASIMAMFITVQNVPAQQIPEFVRLSEEERLKTAIYIVKAQYPPLAKATKVSGSVVVELIVDERGQVESAKPISGPALLYSAAVESAKHWRFRPALFSDSPVKSISDVTFVFNLNGPSRYVMETENQTIVIPDASDKIDTKLSQRPITELGLVSIHCSFPAIIKVWRGPVEVRGRVVDELTGRPVPAATVRTVDTCNTEKYFLPHQVVTDSQGNFSFPTLRQDEISFVVSKNGYMETSKVLNTVRYPELSEYDVDHNIGRITLRVIPVSDITGVVTDENGISMRGVPVKLVRYTSDNGRHCLARCGHLDKYTTTGDDGSYRFEGLLPGRYYLVAGTFPYFDLILNENGESFALEPMQVPTSRVNDENPLMQIAAGDHIKVNFQLHRKRLYHITGSYSETGRFRSDINVRNRSGAVLCSSDERSRRFETWLPSGTYQLVLSTDGNFYRGSVSLRVNNSDVSNVVIRAFSLATVKPTVEISVDTSRKNIGKYPCDKTKAECGTAMIALVRHSTDVNPWPSSNEAEISSDTSEEWVRLESDRTATESIGIWAGTYDLSLFVWDVGLYPKNITRNGKDLLKESVVISPENGDDPIKVVLAEGGIIEGAVSNGDWLVNARIYVIRLEPETSQFPYVNCDGGKFVTYGLAPGRYVLIATQFHLNLDVSNPKVVNYLRKHGQVVDVKAGDKIQLVMQVASPEISQISELYP